MSKMVLAAAAGLAVAIMTIAVIYGMGAFGHWNADPGAWPGSNRGLLAFLMLLGPLAGAFTAASIVTSK